MGWRRALAILFVAYGLPSCGRDQAARDAASAEDGAGDRGAADGPPVLYCAATQNSWAAINPEILIVADGSAAMADDPTGAPCAGLGCSKWDQTRAILERLVLQTDTTIDWGVELFPSGTDACSVDSAPKVEVGPQHAAAVISALGAAAAAGGAPTGLAVSAAAAALSNPNDAHPKYLLLATAGLPACAPGAADPAAPDVAGAVQAVQDAFAAGLPTFVLGAPTTSDPTSDAALMALGVAGGRTVSGGPTYYPIADPAGLFAALSPNDGSRSCTLSLGPAPAGGTSNADIEVFFNNAPIPRDPTDSDGWDYSDAAGTVITFYGSACLAIVDSAAGTLTVAYRCVGG